MKRSQLAITEHIFQYSLKYTLIILSLVVHEQEDALLGHDALLLIAKATNDAVNTWNQSIISVLRNSDLMKEYLLKVWKSQGLI